MNQKISILGAGLVGSLLSILLQKKGYQVTIFERRSDMRNLALSAGRSINLAMSMRGWAGLEMAGLREEIEQIAIPMYGRQIHAIDGSQTFQAYGKNNEAIYSVSRGELNKKLMTLAEKAGVEILFNQKVIDINLENNLIQIENDNGISTSENHDIVIAADGAFSALRNAYLKTDRYDYQQFYIPHGYKELTIPAGVNNSFLMEKNALHIWPRKNFMLIALPNLDGSFTCTLFFPFEGEVSFQSIQTDEDITTFFQTYFPDVMSLIPTLLSDYKNNPTASLVTVKCYPWIYKNKNMLIGDAAHAIVPFYGQGMNAGFEDCRLLMGIIEKNDMNDWTQIFKQYQQARKPQGDAVADLALQNFIEMRDLVADPTFLKRKKIEKELGKLFPAIFNSVYEMVSFSHTPYFEAISCQQAQDRLLEKVMQAGEFEELIPTEDFKNQLNDWMNEYAEEIKKIKLIV
ncbi:MAG: FAD-dependent monooxygenase [Bacteroidetes bacterium]|nr:FAD-dependent monooxygenase [Bacteroidota bacterium]